MRRRLPPHAHGATARAPGPRTGRAAGHTTHRSLARRPSQPPRVTRTLGWLAADPAMGASQSREPTPWDAGQRRLPWKARAAAGGAAPADSDGCELSARRELRALASDCSPLGALLTASVASACLRPAALAGRAPSCVLQGAWTTRDGVGSQAYNSMALLFEAAQLNCTVVGKGGFNRADGELLAHGVSASAAEGFFNLALPSYSPPCAADTPPTKPAHAVCPWEMQASGDSKRTPPARNVLRDKYPSALRRAAAAGSWCTQRYPPMEFRSTIFSRAAWLRARSVLRRRLEAGPALSMLRELPWFTEAEAAMVGKPSAGRRLARHRSSHVHVAMHVRRGDTYSPGSWPVGYLGEYRNYSSTEYATALASIMEHAAPVLDARTPPPSARPPANSPQPPTKQPPHPSPAWSLHNPRGHRQQLSSLVKIKPRAPPTAAARATGGASELLIVHVITDGPWATADDALLAAALREVNASSRGRVRLAPSRVGSDPLLSMAHLIGADILLASNSDFSRAASQVSLGVQTRITARGFSAADLHHMLPLPLTDQHGASTMQRTACARKSTPSEQPPSPLCARLRGSYGCSESEVTLLRESGARFRCRLERYLQWRDGL